MAKEGSMLRDQSDFARENGAVLKVIYPRACSRSHVIWCRFHDSCAFSWSIKFVQDHTAVMFSLCSRCSAILMTPSLVVVENLDLLDATPDCQRALYILELFPCSMSLISASRLNDVDMSWRNIKWDGKELIVKQPVLIIHISNLWIETWEAYRNLFCGTIRHLAGCWKLVWKVI